MNLIRTSRCSYLVNFSNKSCSVKTCKHLKLSNSNRERCNKSFQDICKLITNLLTLTELIFNNVEALESQIFSTSSN